MQRGRQRAADDYDLRGEAVVTAMQNVPDEHGGGRGGQQAGSYVQVAGVGQVCVGPDSVEGHETDHQDKTCRRRGRGRNSDRECPATGKMALRDFL